MAESLLRQADLEHAEEVHALARLGGPVDPEQPTRLDRAQAMAPHPAVTRCERTVERDPVRFLEGLGVEFDEMPVHEIHRGAVGTEVDVRTPVVGVAERDPVGHFAPFAVEDPDLGGSPVEETVRFEVHHHRHQEDAPRPPGPGWRS